MVECTVLENRRWRKPSVSSNLTASARKMAAALRRCSAGPLVLALALALAAGAAQAGEYRRAAFHSALLKRDVPMVGYVPSGFDASDRRYPVTYLLHGAGGSEIDWRNEVDLVAWLDDLIARGAVRPRLFVMPTLGPHTWWTDGAASPAHTAFLEELLPFVERTFRATDDGRSRAVVGISMGGYGAVTLALAAPERFCAVGALAPAVYDPLPPAESAARTSPQFQRDGRFDEARWQAANYPLLIEGYRTAARQVAFWIGTGDHDHLGIAVESAKLHWRLHAIQPQRVELRVIDGGHDWVPWRALLPELLDFTERHCRAG